MNMCKNLVFQVTHDLLFQVTHDGASFFVVVELMAETDIEDMDSLAWKWDCSVLSSLLHSMYVRHFTKNIYSPGIGYHHFTDKDLILHLLRTSSGAVVSAPGKCLDDMVK